MDTRQPHIGVTIVTILVAVILQLVLAPAITLFGVVPNFILVAAVIIAMRNGPVRATVIGFLLVSRQFRRNMMAGAVKL